jgi:plasmid stability protein
MAQLIVRKIDEKIVNRLKRRAAKHGVSMEEEHRRILREILQPLPKPKMNFKEFLLTCPDFGDPDELRPKDLPREIDLE